MKEYEKTTIRPAIAYMRKEFDNLPVRGAEVGVYIGEHAESILNNLNMQRLYLIDAWDDFQKDVSERWKPAWAKIGREKEPGTPVYMSCLKRFENNDNVSIIRKPSILAASSMVAIGLDFVYIDAGHEYENVLTDLVAWYLLVRKGGIIAGHDFDWPSVARAVNDFSKITGLKIQSDTVDFWMVK